MVAHKGEGGREERRGRREGQRPESSGLGGLCAAAAAAAGAGLDSCGLLWVVRVGVMGGV